MSGCAHNSQSSGNSTADVQSPGGSSAAGEERGLASLGQNSEAGVIVTAAEAAAFWKKLRTLQASGQLDAAIKFLEEALGSKKSWSQRNLMEFAAGDLAMRLGDNKKSNEYFEKLLKQHHGKFNLVDYVQLELGLLARQQGDLKHARQHLEAVLSTSYSNATSVLEARTELAHLAMQQKDWKGAESQLLILKKKGRRLTNYNDLLNDLLRVQMKLGYKDKVCSLSRSLYVDGILKWVGATSEVPGENNLDLRQIPGCSLGSSDHQKRLRRLLTDGYNDVALKEIEWWKAQKKNGPDDFTLDSLIALEKMLEGQPAAALELLVPYYDSHQTDYNYLIQLGKTAARAEEYALAVGAYDLATELEGRLYAPEKNLGNSSKLTSGQVKRRRGLSRKLRKQMQQGTSHYQAAFLSYQFQDYDGATRRFNQFLERFPKSKMEIDARWHLAWIEYLKGNDEQAQFEFSKAIIYNSPLNLEKSTKISTAFARRTRMRTSKKKSGSHLTDQILGKSHIERARYWFAMSALRSGRLAIAKRELESLARDPAWGYYRFVAQARLAAESSRLKLVHAAPTDAPFIEPAKMAELSAEVVADGLGLSLSSEADTNKATDNTISDNNGKVDSSDDLASQSSNDENDKDNDEDKEDKEDKDESEAKDEADLGEGFDSPNLSYRFERAQDLLTIGKREWAALELKELEPSVRQRDDRRRLMQQFALVEEANRSSSIAELGFAEERYKGGLKGARDLWQMAFPRPFEKIIQSAGKASGIDTDLIWSIMRAESHYQVEAISGVGAVGLMQLMPKTARRVAQLMGWLDYQDQQLRDFEVNIRLGARYLARLSEKFKSSLPLMAAAYNAGPHRVHAWINAFGQLEMDEFIEHIPFIETRNYVKKIIRNFELYKKLYANSLSAGSESSNDAKVPYQYLIREIGTSADQDPQKLETW